MGNAPGPNFSRMLRIKHTFNTLMANCTDMTFYIPPQKYRLMVLRRDILDSTWLSTITKQSGSLKHSFLGRTALEERGNKQFVHGLEQGTSYNDEMY